MMRAGLAGNGDRLLRLCAFRGNGDFLRRDRYPALGPEADCVHHAIEVLALAGQAVLDADRRLRDDDPLDDALVLKLLEPLGEQAIVQARHGIADIGKADAPAAHGADDGAGPAFADQLHRLMEGWAECSWNNFVFHEAILYDDPTYCNIS